jgi:hypothetical protein
MRARLKALSAEYGGVCVVIYIAVAIGVVAAFATAFLLGLAPETLGEGAGLWIGVYVTLKATQPVRIGVTIALTPIVARSWRRVTGRGAAVTPPDRSV